MYGVRRSAVGAAARGFRVCISACMCVREGQSGVMSVFREHDATRGPRHAKSRFYPFCHTLAPTESTSRPLSAPPTSDERGAVASMSDAFCQDAHRSSRVTEWRMPTIKGSI